VASRHGRGGRGRQAGHGQIVGLRAAAGGELEEERGEKAEQPTGGPVVVLRDREVEGDRGELRHGVGEELLDAAEDLGGGHGDQPSQSYMPVAVAAS
jgi:hypothetical protein